jgi:hypothetical protein
MKPTDFWHDLELLEEPHDTEGSWEAELAALAR